MAEGEGKGLERKRKKKRKKKERERRYRKTERKERQTKKEVDSKWPACRWPTWLPPGDGSWTTCPRPLPLLSLLLSGNPGSRRQRRRLRPRASDLRRPQDRHHVPLRLPTTNPVQARRLLETTRTDPLQRHVLPAGGTAWSAGSGSWSAEWSAGANRPPCCS